jgi:hypothetical protein
LGQRGTGSWCDDCEHPPAFGHLLISARRRVTVSLTISQHNVLLLHSRGSEPDSFPSRCPSVGLDWARLIWRLQPSISRRPSAPASLVAEAGKRLLHAISETIGVPGELNLGNRDAGTPALARSPLALAYCTTHPGPRTLAKQLQKGPQ